MTQNVETSFRFERAQGAKWSQLARNRGDPEAIQADLHTLNRESLAQCVSDQLAEFNGRKKGYEQKKQSKPAFPAYGKGGAATAREAVVGTRRTATEKLTVPTA